MNAKNIFCDTLIEYLDVARETHCSSKGIYGSDDKDGKAKDAYLTAFAKEADALEKLVLVAKNLGDQKDKIWDELVDKYKKDLEKAEKLFRSNMKSASAVQKDTYSDFDKALWKYERILELVRVMK